MGSFIPILIANKDQITYYIANYLQQYIIDHSKLSVCLSIHPSCSISSPDKFIGQYTYFSHFSARDMWEWLDSGVHMSIRCEIIVHPQNRIKSCLESGFPGGKSQSRMLLFAQHGVT